MKKLTLLLLLTLPFMLACCGKIPPLDLGFSNPSDVFDIDSVFSFENVDNHDLLTHFGSENINFGAFPPALDSIQFKVEGMDYLYCDRYIYNPATGEIIHSHADPPTYEPSDYQHHFKDHHFGQNMAWHKLKTRDPSGNIYTRTNDTVYVIGHDSLFTVYYLEKFFEEGSGNPTNAIIISGTLVYDSTTVNDSIIVNFVGVRDYIIGKKILKYDYMPTQAYAPGTIEIKKHPGISAYYKWDTEEQ